jgi:hypothetical protein
MRKLSNRVQNLISDALNTLGKGCPEDQYYYIEEQLTPRQAPVVLEFLQWLDATNLGYGRANAQQRWSEFKSGAIQPKSTYYDMIKTFTYTVPAIPRPQTATFKIRLWEPTIEAIASLIKDSNRDMDWQDFIIVDNTGNEVKRFTPDEVWAATEHVEYISVHSDEYKQLCAA